MNAGLPCTATARLDVPVETLGRYLADIANLPRWAGFFTEVSGQLGNGHRVGTVLGHTMLVVLEHRQGPGDEHRVVIRSCRADRADGASVGVSEGSEEQAVLMLRPDGRRSLVEFTITVRPELLGASVHDADLESLLETQRIRMRAELGRAEAGVMTA